MDRIQDDAGCNTIRGGSSSDRRMQQHQQNSGSHSNSPAHPLQLPPPQQVHKCPRCDSTNTKFCYYNNYSLSQPRYFCKACRRYWTQGGTLRNVPFGGGFRKGSKRTKTSTTATATSTSSTSVSSHSQPPAGTVTPAIIGSNISYYPSGSGGFLSSLEAIQPSLGQPELDLGGSSSSGVNIGLLQGLGILPALSSQAQLFRGLPPPPPSSSNNEWFTQGLSRSRSSNNENPSGHITASVDSTGFWNLNRTSGAVNSATASDGDTAGQGAVLNPNQWLGLPGYGPAQRDHR